LQGGLDLNSDEISLIVDAALTNVPDQPLLANDHEQHMTSPNMIVQVLSEISP